jgi:hypothetical protein
MRGIIMQYAASLGQSQQTRKISPMVAGISAAAIGAAMTLTLMSSSPAPVTASEQATTSMKQCQMIQRKLMVSTTTGGGTIRLREGSYLSPPITLGATPTSVVFPLPRPDTVPVEEVLTIEGNANDVVITSEVTNLRRVFDVTGIVAFNITWKPLKTC